MVNNWFAAEANADAWEDFNAEVSEEIARTERAKAEAAAFVQDADFTAWAASQPPANDSWFHALTEAPF